MSIDYTKRQRVSFMWLSLSLIGGIGLVMWMHDLQLKLMAIAFGILSFLFFVFFLVRFIQTTFSKRNASKIRNV